MIAGYQLSDCVGKTTGSRIYRARQSSDMRPVLLRIPADESSPQVAGLRREFEFLRGLHVPGLLNPIGVAGGNRQPAMVLRDCPGRLLKSILDESRITLRASLQIAFNLVRTLGQMHSTGVVYGDLRPANIIVSSEDWETCIVDCSVCSGAITSEARERNWAYLSPEQTGRTKRAVDHRTDLYSLGVLLYQMLTGRVPFHGGDPLEWAHAHIAVIPVSPSELTPELPAVLSEIVLKLLAKAPEDRYQTARGLEHDLHECITCLSATGAIAPFDVATHDVPEEFHPSRKLYGREREIGELIAAFKRTADIGQPEIALISGEAGIGKSSTVHEAQQTIIEAGGRFIEGKFDLYKREVPFSTLTEAFRDLVEQILTESDERIDALREQIKESLGANGQLILDVIPQLELIIGPQPPVAEVAPDAAQNRFRRVFRSFIGVFTRRERPLVLFLDDVQWVDSATLALAAQLMAPCHECHILLIAAYRDNEVPDSHPMNSVLAGLRDAGTGVTHVQLGPLQQQELNQFLADSLHTKPEKSALLAEIVAEKTRGNPFFALQFLTALHDQHLITFDTERREWVWNIESIRTRNLTDNVAELMADKLQRLPGPVQRALSLAACLGCDFNIPTLATLIECSRDEATARLTEAVKAGMILCSEGLTCRFLHDRIRDAAYSLIPAEARPGTHLHIGRLMLACASEQTTAEKLFEIVNQLSRGTQAVTEETERNRIRHLQVLAGRQAKSEGAFASARDYFVQAVALFPADVWTSDYQEAFSTFIELAECQHLTGSVQAAEEVFRLLMTEARSDMDRARVCRLRVTAYANAGHYDKSLEAGLEGLRLLGVSIPDSGKELEDATRDELCRVQENLHNRSIAELADTPAASDQRTAVAIGLLVDALPGAYIARPQLYTFVAAKAVDLSLQFGATEESAVAYALYCLVLVSRLEDYTSAVELCEMALRLNEQRGWLRFSGRLLTINGSVVRHWRAHVAGSSEPLRQALHANLAVGDFEYAGFAAWDLWWTAFLKGDPLDEVSGLCREHEELARSIHNDILGQISAMERQFVACLKGLTREETGFGSEDFDENSYLASIEQSSFGTGRTYYEIAKEIATFLLGHSQQALQHGRRASFALPALPALMIEATHLFFYALATAAFYPNAPAPERRELSQRLHDILQKLRIWADNCPDNFLNWYALVSAELARIEGRELDAERSYEQAIDSARDNGFIHYQAIASELASNFYRARGFSRIADTFMKEACSLYGQWGADAKVAQLERMYPQLRPVPQAEVPTLGEQLDVMAVVRASQALSSQIELDQLLRTLMTITLQSAGAQKACLFLASGNAMELAATGTANQAQTSILVRGDAGFSEQAFPLSVINYVRRTKQKVLLDEGSIAGPFSSDEYLLKERPRSLLCLPILKQQELTGLLCLENHTISQAFTPQRIGMLEAVAAQAAISLQNAQLYASLQRENNERKKVEEHLRRSETLLAEGERLSHTGTFFRDLVTGERHWSDEFYRILGYQPEEASCSSEAFLERVHPEDRADFHIRSEDLAKRRTDHERRFRLALPDGSIRYVQSIAHPVFNEAGETVGIYGVAVEETERKRAEMLREGEARVLEMIARSAPLPDILSELVRVVESQSDGMFCTVLLLDRDGIHIRHGASPSLPETYTGPIDGEMIGPRHGSCGTAAYRGETIIVTDIADDPLWENWRPLALSHGLHACWSAPIFSSSGKVLGTFAMYYREPRSPAAAEMDLIHFAAHLAGIGIERKNMETELIESRNELQQVTDSISDSVWSAELSAEGELSMRYSSPVIQRLTGRPPEFFMESPQRWLSIVHPDDSPRLNQRLEMSKTNRTAPPEEEYRIILPDGSIRWIRDSIRITPLENGGMRMHGVLSDITARKQAEEGFRQSRELLQNVLDSSEAVIYVKDLEGRYLLANRRVSELCSFSQETIIGKTDYELFTYEHAEGFRLGDRQALTAGAPIEIEETATGPDHQLRTYISIKTVLRDRSGKPYAVCGVSTDITERKRLEEQLREAQKMEAIGKLAGGIAHDFNNLMTIVTGYSELLEAALAGDPNLSEKAAEIHKAGEQAAGLTRQLLAFSRRQVLQKKVLNLNEVLSGMSSMMRRLLRDDIELEIMPGPALASVRGDSGQFQQIIMNLIINARDAMPEGGRITIATENVNCDEEQRAGKLHGPCVRLAVSDTGHGMPHEVREHIFEPFFTTKEPGRGTGLGLATVHGVVQQAGGHVAVESDPGRGTTFYIYLPTAEGDVSPKPLQMPQPKRGSETILVVEDQEGLRALITEILRKHGYKVLSASNGREALRVLETTAGRIELIVTDLVMPQMGGRALAAALPDVHPETRVIYMSGYVENLEELLAPGHTFIEKPFAPDALLRAVRDVLDKRGADLARPA